MLHQMGAFLISAVVFFVLSCTQDSGLSNLAALLPINGAKLSPQPEGGCGSGGHKCPRDSVCCNSGNLWDAEPTKGACYSSCGSFSGSSCTYNFNETATCALSLCYDSNSNFDSVCAAETVRPTLAFQLKAQPAGGCGSGQDCPSGAWCCNNGEHWDGQRSEGLCYSCGVEPGSSCDSGYGSGDTCKAALCWGKSSTSEQCSCWADEFGNCVFGQTYGAVSGCQSAYPAYTKLPSCPTSP